MANIIFQSMSKQKEFAERIEQVRIYERLSRLDISKIIGYGSVHPYTSIVNGKQNLTLEKLILFTYHFSHINLNWLITGKGDMLEATNGEKTITDLSTENQNLKTKVLKLESKIEVLKELNKDLTDRLSS